MKILLLGSTGLLGSTLGPFLRMRGYEVVTHGCSKSAQYQIDLKYQKDVNKLLRNAQADIIINLVGFTDVDLCETHPNQAYLINVRTVENIANWIIREKRHCHLLHLSTDQVYDGNFLHTEEQVTLMNYYAFSKYAGELAANKIPSTIIRTNFVGRSQCTKRTSLTDWLFHSLTNNKSIQVFDDVLFNPLSMTTLSEMIELAILEKIVGVFNLGSHEGKSKADFAFAFADELGLSTKTMMRTTTDQVDFLKAYRPKDMRMDCTKFENALSIKLPLLKKEIELVASKYHETT